MIGAILGAAGSLVSSGIGAIAAARQNKKNQQILNEQNAMLAQQYYRGVLDDPGSQSYLRSLRENIQEQMGGIDNNAVASGMTQENVLAAKDTANKAVTDAVGGLLQQKEASKQGYLNGLLNAQGNQMANNSAAAQNWMQLASNISSSIGDIAQSYSMSDDKLFPVDTPPDK